MPRKGKPIAHVVLRRAREAARAGDWERASAQYDLYWEVTEGVPALTGVRSSYGLSEWAKVSEKYPPGLERMRERLRECLAKFERTDHFGHLNDAKAFDRVFGSRVAIDLAVRLHGARSPLAGNAVFCLWRDLLEAGHEDVVAEGIQDVERYYAPTLGLVDALVRMKRRGYPSLDVEYGRKRFRDDVRLLLRTLEVAGRADERAALEARARRDAESRGFLLLE